MPNSGEEPVITTAIHILSQPGKKVDATWYRELADIP